MRGKLSRTENGTAAWPTQRRSRNCVCQSHSNRPIAMKLRCATSPLAVSGSSGRGRTKIQDVTLQPVPVAHVQASAGWHTEFSTTSSGRGSTVDLGSLLVPGSLATAIVPTGILVSATLPSHPYPTQEYVIFSVALGSPIASPCSAGV